ncbi:MAG: hypothetical protein IT452_19325 [Planctomycetia bacterium]|nr:hypothetical protein [Planctomycetia bacterium]
MGPKFGLGQRVATADGLRGTVESVFLTAAHAWMAQIARPRFRLRARVPDQDPTRLPRPRVGRPFPRPAFHYFVVSGATGGFVAEAELQLVSGRSAPTKFPLGASATAPWDFRGVVTALHRNFRSAVLCGLVGPGWFAAQQLRPRSKRQPFYSLTGDRGFGSVLAGEAELRRYRP